MVIDAVDAFGQTPATINASGSTPNSQIDSRDKSEDSMTERPENHDSLAHKEPSIEEVNANKSSRNNIPPDPQATNEGWQFQLFPYIWIAGISGHAGIGDIIVDVNSAITDSDVHLNFGFMATFEARKDKLLLVTDLQYANLGTDRPRPAAPIFTSASADFKTFVLDPKIGYRVAQNSEKGRFLDVLGGIRYYHVRSDLTLDSIIVASRFASASKDWVDVVGGLRGRANLSPKLFLVGKGDVGGGGSKVTYQLFGGLGYQISQRIAVIGGYRDLKVDYDKDLFLFDVSLNGPLIGLGIKF
jgi:hypothetical protein